MFLPMVISNKNKKDRENLCDQLHVNPTYRRALEAHLAEKRRKREVLDNDLRENGVIHEVHVREATTLLYDYFLQERDIQSLNKLRGIENEIGEFIDLVAIANDGPEALERTLQKFRESKRNHSLEVPDDCN